MNRKEYLSDEMRRVYRIRVELATACNTTNIFDWLDKGYLTEVEANDLLKYNGELNEDLRFSTGD